MTGKELENSILDVSRYIGRVLTSRETQIIISVLNLGFDVESIIYALEITVNAVHDFKLNYAEKVLYNWHDNGCKNIAEGELPPIEIGGFRPLRAIYYSRVTSLTVQTLLYKL